MTCTVVLLVIRGRRCLQHGGSVPQTLSSMGDWVTLTLCWSEVVDWCFNFLSSSWWVYTSAPLWALRIKELSFIFNACHHLTELNLFIYGG